MRDSDDNVNDSGKLCAVPLRTLELFVPIVGKDTAPIYDNVGKSQALHLTRRFIFSSNVFVAGAVAASFIT